MIDPFPKCKTCSMSGWCRKVRAGLVYYFNGGRLLKANQMVLLSKCPACVLNPNHFKVLKRCPVCYGEGEVASVKIPGTYQNGEDALLDYILWYESLSERMRTAVGKWLLHVDMGIPVPAQRWMRGWPKVVPEDSTIRVCYLDNTAKIVEYYCRTVSKRRPTRRAVKYFERCLGGGLRWMALECRRKMYEGNT